MNKQSEKAFKFVGLAAICALVGLIIYIITSVTGYLAASKLDVMPVITTLGAILLMAALFLKGDKLTGAAADIVMLASIVLLLYSFYEFVIGRVSLVADVYFIPVNYPASEKTAVYISLVGIMFYIIADIMMITAGFMRRKDER